MAITEEKKMLEEIKRRAAEKVAKKYDDDELEGLEPSAEDLEAEG